MRSLLFTTVRVAARLLNEDLPPGDGSSDPSDIPGTGDDLNQDSGYDKFFGTVAISGGILAWIAAFIGIYMIYKHLTNYVEPIFQRYVVRVLFMIPIFSLCSWGSLVVSEDKALYVEAVAGFYEAYVLYNFVALCIEFLGGPGAIVVKMEGHTFPGSWISCTCHMDGAPIDGKFVRDCKRGMIQFVVLKPILIATDIILHLSHAYHESQWGFFSGWMWTMIIYNFSYTWALYALLNFYIGCHHALAPMRPLLKFGVIKVVVFLTFWQGMVCSTAVSVGLLRDAEDATLMENWLLCAEMFLVSLVAPLAFSHKEYVRDARGHIETNIARSLNHAFNFADVIADTRHQFGKKYHDYVLYADLVRNKREDGILSGANVFAKGLGQILGTDQLLGKKDVHSDAPSAHGHDDKEVEMGMGKGDESSSHHFGDHHGASQPETHEASMRSPSPILSAPSQHNLEAVALSHKSESPIPVSDPASGDTASPASPGSAGAAQHGIPPGRRRMGDAATPVKLIPLAPPPSAGARAILPPPPKPGSTVSPTAAHPGGLSGGHLNELAMSRLAKAADHVKVKFNPTTAGMAPGESALETSSESHTGAGGINGVLEKVGLPALPPPRTLGAGLQALPGVMVRGGTLGLNKALGAIGIHTGAGPDAEAEAEGKSLLAARKSDAT